MTCFSFSPSLPLFRSNIQSSGEKSLRHERRRLTIKNRTILYKCTRLSLKKVLTPHYPYNDVKDKNKISVINL